MFLRAEQRFREEFGAECLHAAIQPRFRGINMRKTMLCALAVLAAAVSTSAVAKDLKQDRKAPTMSATRMNDSEMDRVTAGAAGGNGNGQAWGLQCTPAWQCNGSSPNGRALGRQPI